MGKKLISIVLVTFILVSLLMPVGANEESSTIELSADNTVLQEGSTVKVSIKVKNIADLFGIQFKLGYQKNILKYQTNSISDKYDTLDSQKINEDTGEISNVLILRRDASDKGFKESIELATFTFKALKTGKASLAISEVKAICSETFINDFGKKDLKTIQLSSMGPVQIDIISKGTGDTGSSEGNTPALVDELKKIDELSNRNLKSAVEQMNNLLDKLDSNTSSADKNKLADSIGKLAEGLLQLNPAAVNENGKSIVTLESQALGYAINQFNTLLTKSTAKGINAKVNKEVKVSIAEDKSNEVRISGSDISSLSKAGFNISIKSETIELHLPSGSFAIDGSDQLAITITPENQKKVTQNSAVYNPINAYNLEAEIINGANKSKIKNFKEKVAVEVKYNPNGINKGLLGLYTFNESTGIWEYIKSSKHDKEGNSFKAGLEHFSKYAVIEFKKEYTDISDTYSTAQNAISVLSAKHIVSGINATQYAPKKGLTRAEFTSLIVKALDINLVKYKGSFKDVKNGAWYTEYVEAAYEAGLISGVGAQNFDPNGKITREQMAVLITKAYEYKGIKLSAGTDKFADDSKLSNWASEYVYKAKAAGFISGIGDNRLDPQGNTNRADAAVILLKLISKLELL